LVGTDDIAQLEDVAGRLELTDRRLFQLGQVHEALAILVQTFRFEKESLEGADLAALAAATRGFHEDLAARARCFVALLDPVPRHRELTREEKVHASCS
jgi:hypothetical protein